MSLSLLLLPPPEIEITTKLSLDYVAHTFHWLEPSKSESPSIIVVGHVTDPSGGVPLSVVVVIRVRITVETGETKLNLRLERSA